MESIRIDQSREESRRVGIMWITWIFSIILLLWWRLRASCTTSIENTNKSLGKINKHRASFCLAVFNRPFKRSPTCKPHRLIQNTQNSVLRFEIRQNPRARESFEKHKHTQNSIFVRSLPLSPPPPPLPQTFCERFIYNHFGVCVCLWTHATAI